MEFRDTPEEAAFRAEVRAFIKEHLPAGWGTLDAEAEFTGVDDPEREAFIKQWRTALARRGWIAPHWPKEYGGAGLTPGEQFIFNEEMAEARAPAVGGFGVQMIGPILILYGTDEQKKEHLPRITSGEVTWCQGYSEPNAGSDLASLQTRAVRDGDEYVINGQKIWSSGAHRADWMFMLARTDPDAPKHRGISMLLVDMKTPGITVRHTVNDLTQFAREGARQSGIPVRLTDSIRLELAERAIEAEIARLISYRIISLQKRGVVPNYEASMNKLFRSEASQRVAQTGMKLNDLYGNVFPRGKYAAMRGRISTMYLTSVSATIAAGTSEIQRNIIATRGLGLPRG